MFSRWQRFTRRADFIIGGLACVASVGERGWGNREKERDGEGDRAPAIRTAIGSILRSLAAAKF